jgi:hypothetical protein
VPPDVVAAARPEAAPPAVPHPAAPPGGRRARRLRDLAAAALCAALTLALLLADGGVWAHVAGGDLHSTFLPKYEHVAAAVRAWRLPLWNPYEFCGTPLLANAQAGALYPPVLVLFALLPPWAALQAFYGGHVLLLAWGVIAYLGTEAVPRWAAAAAALVAVAGVLEARGVALDHPNFIACVAWVPLQLLCWRNAVARGRRWLAALALAVAMPWLAGYPDFPMDGAVLLAVVAAVAGRGAGAIAVLVAGLALGTALAAVQLVPLAELVGESLRAENDRYPLFRSGAAVQSLGALAVQLVERYGLVALGLAAAALVLRPTRTQLARLAAFLWCLFALNVPLNLLYRLPPFAGVRLPLGWRYLAPVFLALLAGVGMAAVHGRGRPWRRRVALLLALAAGVRAALALEGAIESLPERRLLLDVAARRAPVLDTFRRERFPARLLTGVELGSGAPLRHRLPTPAGYEPSLVPRRVVQLLRPLRLWRNDWDGRGIFWPALTANPHLAALLGVGIVSASRPQLVALQAVGFAPVRRMLPPDEITLYRPPVPRARVVHDAVVVADEDESLARVRAEASAAPARVVVEAGVPLPPLAPPPAGAAEGAEILLDLPERVEVEATLASPGILALTDTFYPGWDADVGGRPVAVLRVDHAFRGVALAPGRHRVVFRYRPRSVRLGAAVSAAALAITAVLLALPRRRAA